MLNTHPVLVKFMQDKIKKLQQLKEVKTLALPLPYNAVDENGITITSYRKLFLVGIELNRIESNAIFKLYGDNSGYLVQAISQDSTDVLELNVPNLKIKRHKPLYTELYLIAKHDVGKFFVVYGPKSNYFKDSTTEEQKIELVKSFTTEVSSRLKFKDYSVEVYHTIA